MESKGLGWVPGKVDPRDYQLAPRLSAIREPRTSGSQWWFSPTPRLDQKSEGSCVGFSRTIATNAAPKVQHYDNAYARSLYKLAQDLDQWEGSSYEGTSVRAGAKAAVQKGLISAYAFAQDVEEVAMWVLNKSPVCIGVDWHESDYNASRENDYFLTGEGEVVGGHALTIDGVKWIGKDTDHFRILNSWGSSFGYNGRARITVPMMERLLSSPHSVACTALEV